MDIKKLAVKENTTIHLKDAEGELLYDGDNKVTVTVFGPGTKVYAKAQAAQNRRMVERMKSKNKQGFNVTVDRAEFLADITDSFSHLQYGDGELTGRELAKAVYSDLTVGFIAEQVNAEAGDWANFTNGSTTA